MKKLLMVSMVLVMATVALATPDLQVTVDPQSGSAGYNHSYDVTIATGSVGIYGVGDTFRSFCLERSESVGQGILDVEIGTAAMGGGIGGGPSGDPLDVRTAYLYESFLNGDLASVGFDGSEQSYYALQNVIWAIEEEGSVIDLTTGLAADLLAYANATDWTDLGGIRVMVMYDAQGNYVQDMLVRTIPTPGAVILGSIGVGLVGWIRRRRSI